MTRFFFYTGVELVRILDLICVFLFLVVLIVQAGLGGVRLNYIIIFR